MKFGNLVSSLTVLLLAGACSLPLNPSAQGGPAPSARPTLHLAVLASGDQGRGLTDDGTVQTVTVEVTNAGGTVLGTCALTKGSGFWAGDLSVEETGPATFRAYCRNADGRLLYLGKKDQTLSGLNDRISVSVQALTVTGGGVSGQALSLLGSVTTFAGSKSQFFQAEGVASDGTSLFVADTNNHLIRRLDLATGLVSTLAGTPGSSGFADGPAASAIFNSPVGLATDGTYVYVADSLNYRVRQIAIADGTVTTLAGGTPWGNLDGNGTSAKFRIPKGLVLVGRTLYVSDSTNQNLRAIDLDTKAVTTLAGVANPTPVSGTTDATGTSARFYQPRGIASDGTNLYVADMGNNKIRQVTLPGGVVTTLAGSGTAGFAEGSGAAAQFSAPEGVATDGTFVYVSDTANHKVRKIALADGAVTIVAGGNGGTGTSTYSGDRDGTGTGAGFNQPKGLALVGTDLYLADSYNSLVRRISSAGAVSTVAGLSGYPGRTNGAGVPTFGSLKFITTDGTDLYATDSLNHVVWKVGIAGGAPSVFAGTLGVSGSSNGTGTSALFNQPTGITTDGKALFVADYKNHVIRKIDLGTAQVTTLAGVVGSTGSALTSLFYYPYGVTTDGTNLYVTDEYSSSLRKVVISSGEVSSLSTGISYPHAITTDGTNLYFTAGSYGHALWQVPVTGGTPTVFAGDASTAGNTDADGTLARFWQPGGLVCDGTSLYVSDTSNYSIRKVTLATGTTTTLAGGSGGYGEADGQGTAAKFYSTQGITTDGTSLFINDVVNHTIRRLR